MKQESILSKALWGWVFSVIIFGFIGAMIAPERPESMVTIINFDGIVGFLKGVIFNVILVMLLLGTGMFLYPMLPTARKEPTPASRVSCILAVPFLVSGFYFLLGFFQESAAYSTLAQNYRHQHEAMVFILRASGIGMVIAVVVQLVVNALNSRYHVVKK